MQNKKGFTLAEAVAGFAVLAIALLVSMQIYGAGAQNAVKSAQTDANTKRIVYFFESADASGLSMPPSILNGSTQFTLGGAAITLAEQAFVTVTEAKNGAPSSLVIWGKSIGRQP